MIVTFTVTEVEELFTTYDYKQLLKAVNDHFQVESKYQGNDVKSTAYYNPETNTGVIICDHTDSYIYLPDLQHAYGSDFVTVKFKV
jgi:hypothetical protein